MKKNMLAVVILAVTLVNLTLSAMIIFTFIPYVKKADTLITDILKCIQLELESPKAEVLAKDYNIEDLDTVVILEEERANLKTGADGKVHYAQVSATISVNTQHDDFKAKNPSIEKNKNQIQDFVLVEINKYTNDELQQNKVQIEQKVLQQIQEYFDSKFIVQITIKMLVM